MLISAHHHFVTIRVAGSEERVTLDAAPLSHDMIFGAPWLRKHNPLIDFEEEKGLLDMEKGNAEEELELLRQNWNY